MPRNDRVINFLQSISFQAVEAQAAFKLRGILSDEFGDLIEDIEFDLQRIQQWREEAFKAAEERKL